MTNQYLQSNKVCPHELRHIVENLIPIDAALGKQLQKLCQKDEVEQARTFVTDPNYSTPKRIKFIYYLLLNSKHANLKGMLNPEVVDYLIGCILLEPYPINENGLSESYLCYESENLIKFAIYANHPNLANRLIKFFKTDLIAIGNSPNTILHAAATMGAMGILEPFINSGSKTILNRRNSEGQTLLHLACQWKQEAVVRTLLQQRHLNPHLKDAQGWEPMHYAACHQDATITQLLQRHPSFKADRMIEESATLLRIASDNRSNEVIKTVMAFCDPVLKKMSDSIEMFHFKGTDPAAEEMLGVELTNPSFQKPDTPPSLIPAMSSPTMGSQGEDHPEIIHLGMEQIGRLQSTNLTLTCHATPKSSPPNPSPETPLRRETRSMARAR